MSKLRILFFSVVGILMSAITTFAQTEAADNASSVSKYRAIGGGIGFAIAVFGGALGQSRIGASACEGAARNPGAAGRIQTMMILGLALIVVLFAASRTVTKDVERLQRWMREGAAQAGSNS